MKTFKQFLKSDLSESRFAQMLIEQEIYITDAERIASESKLQSDYEKKRKKKKERRERDELFNRRIYNAKQLARDIKVMSRLKAAFNSEMNRKAV